MYDIEHCEIVTADGLIDFEQNLNKYLAKGYVLLPNSMYIQSGYYKYIAMVGKPRTTANKELSI